MRNRYPFKLKNKFAKYVSVLLLMICMIGNQDCFGQATFATLTAGLSGQTLASGTSQAPIYGFSVQVGNTITFKQFNLTFGGASENYFANGTLYRSATNSFNAGSPGTPVGNVVFNGNNVIINNFSETITNTTNFYFLVVDLVNTSTAGQNFYANTGNFATDSNGGTSYAFWGTYIYYNFTTPSPPYQLTVTPQLSGLASTSTVLTAGASDVAMFGFGISSPTNRKITQLSINSNIANLSQFFGSFTLYSTPTNTYSVGARTAVSGTTVTLSGSYVNIAISGNNLQLSGSATYYWLVANVLSNITGTVPINPQFKFSSGQSTTSFTTASPAGTFNTATAFGPIYNVNSASVSMASLTGGLSATTIYGGQSGVAMFGFSVTVSGNTTISQFNINSSNSNLSTYFASGTLYQNSTTTYGTGTATPVGTVTFNGSYVNVTGLTENINNTTKNYFLVLNYTYSGNSASSVAFNFTNGQNSSAIIQSNPTISAYNTFTVAGSNYTLNPPPTASVAMAALTGGLASSNLSYGQTAAVIGFSVKVNFNPVISGVTTTLSKFNIATDYNTNTLQSMFGITGTLYRSVGTSFNSSSPGTAVGTVTLNGSTVTISGLSETFVNDQTNNYFLVLNQSYNNYVTADAVRFFINSATAAVNANGTNYSAYGIYTSNYVVKARTVGYTLTDANTSANGITQGSIYPGQTNVVLFGFGISSNISTTISGFVLNATAGNPSNYFTNASGKLYKSSSNVFSFATATLVSGASFAFNSNISPAITITGISQNLNSTPVYYFIVADVTNSYNTVIAAATTMQFRFQTSQTNAITQTSPASINIAPPVDITGTNFTISPPSAVATGYNAASNGITPSVLFYGQTNIVFFGFKLDVSGIYTINQINIAATNTPGNNYKNGSLYRSSDQYFSHATKISGATISFNSPTIITGLSETLNSTNGTGSYYYFVVGDFNVTPGNYTPGGTTQFNFANGSTSLVNQFNNTITNLTTTNGQVFNLANTYDYVGSVSGDLTDRFNYQTTVATQTPASSPVFAGSTIFVRVGAKNYTYAPTISANMEIGGITFESGSGTPQITIAAGKTLTLNKGLEVLANVNGTISGGSVILPSGSVSSIMPKGTLTLASNAQITNSGTFTILSDASGSGSVAALTGTSSISGTVKVQRFVTGGSSYYRGYRLLSSPVHTASTNYYDLSYLSGSGTYLTGSSGGGWDVNGNPTIYLYRPDKAPSSAFNSGNYRSVSAINNSPAYSLGTLDGNFNMGVGNGYMLFYRGNNSTNVSAMPNSLAFTASGVLNQGDIQVKPWFSGASTLDFTAVTGNSGVKGFHLVGNPYASTIDWETMGTTSNSGIYATNISNTIYIMDPVTQAYAIYQKGGGSTLGASRYIPSGQGFFVLAKDQNAQITFRESAKVSNQVAGNGINGLLLNTAANDGQDRHIRIQLYKDVAIKNDIFIGFKNSASDAYVFNEDAPYINGNAKVSFSSLSSDRLAMAVNYLPLPANKQIISLKFTVPAAGTYKLSMTEIANIPDLFDIWLYDNLTKDSLDARHNNEYNFKTSADTTSFGANRFKLILRQNPAKGVHLLSFSANKQLKAVSLSWTAENEANHTRYSLERSIDAGKTYQVLDSLPSANLGTYTDLDPYPVNGLNQYRLKQTDIFGKVSYSQIVNVMYTPNSTITNLANNFISVYPNPVSTTLNLAIKPVSQTAANYKITITNSSGIVVQSAATADVTWQGDVNKLMPGTYFVQVLNSKENTITGKSTFIKL
jgi:hypothetical protein